MASIAAVANESSGHVWAERYDRPVQDIFAVQDEIADTIAARMEPEIGAVERNERDGNRRGTSAHGNIISAACGICSDATAPT
jgi:hypothetical protein